MSVASISRMSPMRPINIPSVSLSCSGVTSCDGRIVWRWADRCCGSECLEDKEAVILRRARSGPPPGLGHDFGRVLKFSNVFLVAFHRLTERAISMQAPRGLSHLAKLKTIPVTFWTNRHGLFLLSG